MVGVVLGLVVILRTYDFDDRSIQIIRIVVSLLMFGSIVLAAMQFRWNRKQAQKANEWNKKQLAITQMHASRKVMKESLSSLHCTLGILERKNPYELCEIHDVFGVMLKDNTFCFHGEETEDEIKQLPSTAISSDYKCISFRKDINGREVKDALINYLSEYEYICSAVNRDIFDDETVKTLLRGAIVGKYKLFKKYIEHQQESTRNKDYFSEFVSVAKRYMDESR